MTLPTSISRRRFLQSAGAVTAGAAGLHGRLALTSQLHGAHPLAARRTHFAPRAKRLVFIFLTGGMSHVDTFDYKPDLKTDRGKTVQGSNSVLGTMYLIPSRYRFRRHGQSGIAVSELFPHLGGLADDLCVINSMHTDHLEHFQATLAMHTGSTTVPMPGFGAWVSYAMGTTNRNLPAHAVLASEMPYAGSQNWDCNFLPAYHQGTRIEPGEEPVPNLRSPVQSVTLRELEQRMLRDVNQRHVGLRPGDLNLSARMESFKTARGLMDEAPGIFDVATETRATLGSYGTSNSDNRSFGWQCLIARRLIERGVRVVELFHRGADENTNWDHHYDVGKLTGVSQQVDRPVAALISDLKLRGLLDDTLVVIATEFGRTPYERTRNHTGRNHHKDAFTCLLAGAGVKGGHVHGHSDEYGLTVAEDGVHIHDLHATMLYLLGLDHTELTYRYSGRDFRLTDVYGNVVTEILV